MFRRSTSHRGDCAVAERRAQRAEEQDEDVAFTNAFRRFRGVSHALADVDRCAARLAARRREARAAAAALADAVVALARAGTAVTPPPEAAAIGATALEVRGVSPSREGAHDCVRAASPTC